MLFNLTNQTAFKVIKTERAIICERNWGPDFTGALITHEPFNGDEKCESGYGYDVYESQVDADGFDRLIHRQVGL